MVGKGLYINIGLTPLDIQVRRMVEVGARPCAVENSGILGTICWQITMYIGVGCQEKVRDCFHFTSGGREQADFLF